MARPQKNSCDYFPHDAGMRNHKKIKSIRQKFGATGYAIWCMLLELLTESDGNVFEDSEFEIELISGDFGVSVTEIRLVLDYCYRLELLFLNDGFVKSESLDERLEPVYIKRGRSKEISAKQKRINGKFTKNTVTDGVSVTEIPQSKVNKSKVNKIKEDNIIYYDTSFLNLEKDNIKISISEFEKLCKIETQEIIEKAIKLFSDYKIEKNPKTKSDYLTIKRWVIDAVKEKIQKSKKIENEPGRTKQEPTIGGIPISETAKFFGTSTDELLKFTRDGGEP